MCFNMSKIMCICGQNVDNLCVNVDNSKFLVEKCENCLIFFLIFAIIIPVRREYGVE